MKVLLVNKFLYLKGGDAISTLNTGKLLEKKGHQVFYWGMKHQKNPEYPYSEYFVDNIDYENQSIKEKISNSLKILYSFEAKRKIEKFINEVVKPDIVHLNNFAHQISPSILPVMKKYGIPTVMTMHDYKLVCPAYTMLSNDNLCEKCKDRRYYWCFLRKCTKNSYMKSLINTVEMYLHHGILDIYSKIDVFISPSKFLKSKVLEMGFNGNIVVLPNFVFLEEYVPEFNFKENSLCYVGRLSKEKGLFTLIEAFKGLNVTLKIIGTGPIEEDLKIKVKSLGLNNVKFLGYKSGEDLKNEIRNSMGVILPSEWYENNPRTVLEAFALGKPIIGARIGGIPELVRDGETGYTFEPGSVDDLGDKILLFLKNFEKIADMGKNARKFVEENFNPEKHYQELIRIYQMAIQKHE